MGDEQKSKNDVLALLKRSIPGTTNVENCEKLSNCMEKKIRICGDIKVPCIRCLEEGNVIGGLAFPFGINLGLDNNVKNPIVIYRYKQAESYATVIKGENFDDMVEKFEKDENIKDITEKTQFLRDERKEAEKFEKIEAFKRSDANILVVRKNSKGVYDELDLKLIALAKEKEEKTGIPIKIVEETEIKRKVYILGINSKKVFNKIELEIKSIMDADERITMLLLESKEYVTKEKHTKEYVGILAIDSINDNISGENVEKNRWLHYFTKKYTGLEYIETVD